MRVADWIIGSLHQLGLRNVFGVTGGAVVHLFDAASNFTDINTTFFNHEQSASFAAEAYTKLTSEMALCVVTTGPGATNAITGLSAAWLDSIPAIFISGQARSNNLIAGRPLRQVGTQEIDVIPVVKTLTKYAAQIQETGEVRQHLVNALSERFNGRPGPVWLDIPVDVLWSEFDETLLKQEDLIDSKLIFDLPKVEADIEELLRNSSRPLLLLGGGCRTPIINKLLEKIMNIKIPFVTTWLGHDLVPFSCDYHMGHVGISGQRGANLVVGNCDLLISLGSSISNSVTTTKPERFANNAVKVNFNIDPNEFTHTKDLFEHNIKLTASSAIEILEKMASRNNYKIQNDWYEFCKLSRHLSLNEKAPVSDHIHPFDIFRSLELITPPNAVFACDGGGTTVYSFLQAIRCRDNQRLIVVAGLGSMGSGIPEAIGLAQANKPIYLFCGDGSFPFNIQELQVVSDLKLPIIITVFSNNAYLSIRSTQDQFLEGRKIGSMPPDVHLLNIKKISSAFGVDYHYIESVTNYKDKINKWDMKFPQILEVPTSPNQEIQPRQSFKNTGTGFEPNPLTQMLPPLQTQVQEQIDLFQNIFKEGD